MPKIEVQEACRDYGYVKGCKETPDERYTVHPPATMPDAVPLKFCSHCGPAIKMVTDMIIALCEAGGEPMVRKIDAAISEMEKLMAGQQS